MSDIAERKRWDDYMAAYQDMIRETSTDYAPWYVVPADHKHVAWLVVVGGDHRGAGRASSSNIPKVKGKALERARKKAEARPQGREK